MHGSGIGLAHKPRHQFEWWVGSARHFLNPQRRERVFFLLVHKGLCDAAALDHINHIVHVASVGLRSKENTPVSEIVDWVASIGGLPIVSPTAVKERPANVHN